MLSCPLEHVTLWDIHEAVGSPGLLAVGHREQNPTCLVEQAVNAALHDAYRQAEALLLTRLGTVTLAALCGDFHHRMDSGHHSLEEISHGT